MQTLVAEILAAWRHAERLAQSLPPGSPAQQAARRACERLKDAYHDLAGAVASTLEAESRGQLSDALQEHFRTDRVESAG